MIIRIDAAHVMVMVKEGLHIRTAANKAPMSNKAETNPIPNTDTRNMPLLKLETVPDV
jgi:hypothetical protein